MTVKLSVDHEHIFIQGYYGWECDCGLFYAFGSAPWEEVLDDRWVGPGWSYEDWEWGGEWDDDEGEDSEYGDQLDVDDNKELM